VPVEAIMRMAMLGRHERIDSARALQLGVVSDVIDGGTDELHAVAQALAERVAATSPAVLAALKRVLWHGLEQWGAEE
jgi:enoyl-CoA hydratase/carnithine racemase